MDSNTRDAHPHNRVAHEALAALWRHAALPDEALANVALPGGDPVLASSFRVATALQAAIGGASLVAAQIGHERGGPVQTVSVSAGDAVRESACRFTLDGRTLDPWDRFSGLYRCGDGRWVRVHTNFAHHRDAALALLGLSAEGATRDDVTAALRDWTATAFEQAAADRGGVVAAVRSLQEWQAHPQSLAVSALPVVEFERVGDAAAGHPQPLKPGDRPLAGLRVLDLTRILAGPVAGRTLAAYGADVLLVNGPHLPNIEAIAETSRGKRSAFVDLREGAGRETLRDLVRGADVVIQGYRPGALAGRGFGAEAMAQLRPGLVVVSLSAYGRTGPWSGRRGFDSLVQSATGMNLQEAEAFGADAPRALPLQALDYGAGFLMAFGAGAALRRQWREGGSWQVHVSLAGVAHWLRGLGKVQARADAAWPDFAEVMETSSSGFGELAAVRHAARWSHTPPGWDLPSMPPGSHPPAWPDVMG
jgi:crotonobetainyl-CoA:carnitine CoA-transferase CaiB-like acyl-CoA transferase